MFLFLSESYRQGAEQRFEMVEDKKTSVSTLFSCLKMDRSMESVLNNNKLISELIERLTNAMEEKFQEEPDQEKEHTCACQPGFLAWFFLIISAALTGFCIRILVYAFWF